MSLDVQDCLKNVLHNIIKKIVEINPRVGEAIKSELKDLGNIVKSDVSSVKSSNVYSITLDS